MGSGGAGIFDGFCVRLFSRMRNDMLQDLLTSTAAVSESSSSVSGVPVGPKAQKGA